MQREEERKEAQIRSPTHRGDNQRHMTNEFIEGQKEKSVTERPLGGLHLGTKDDNC